MRRLTMVVYSLVIVLAVAGCSELDWLSGGDDGPTAPPVPTPSPPCVAVIGGPVIIPSASGLKVQVFDRSASCGLREWNFADGSTSGIPDPIHTYTTCNDLPYKITLKAWEDGNIMNADLAQVDVEYPCPVVAGPG